MSTRTYNYNGKVYDIPNEKASAFEKKYPDATVPYHVDNQVYDIPVNKQDGFMAKYPNAQLGEISANTPKMLKSPEDDEETNTVEGFGAGFKTGVSQLKEGLKSAVGEAARSYVTGSQNDHNLAKERLLGLETSGYDFSNFNSEQASKHYKKSKYELGMAYWRRTKEDRKKEREGMPWWESVKHKMKDPAQPISPYASDADAFYRHSIAEDAEDNRVYKAIQEALKESNGDINKAYSILDSKKSVETWGDETTREAQDAIANIPQTKGTAAWIGNLVPQMIGTVGSVAASVFPATRWLAKPLAYASMGGLTASAAGSSMAEARMSGASDKDTHNAGLLSAAIEAGTEAIPLSRYIGNIEKKVAKSLTKEIIDKTLVSPIAKKELEHLLNKAAKEMPRKLFNKHNIKEYAKDILAESGSEFLAEFSGTFVPIIYENPDNYPTLIEAVKNGWEGAKGGAFMGGILGAGSTTAGHYANRNRRKKQGSIMLADTPNGVVEIVGEKDENTMFALDADGNPIEVGINNIIDSDVVRFEEFDRYCKDQTQENLQAAIESGKELASSDAATKRQAKAEYDKELLKFYKDKQEELENVENPIDYISEHPEQADVIIPYFNAKAKLEGLLGGVADGIDEQVNQAIKSITDITHESGSIYDVTLNGNEPERANLVRGEIVTKEDGSLDIDSSSNFVFVKINGEIRMVSPKEIKSIDNVSDAASIKQQTENILRSTLVQQYKEEIDPIPIEKQMYSISDEVNINGIDGIIAQVTPDGNYIVQFDSPIDYNGVQQQAHEFTQEALMNLQEQESTILNTEVTNEENSSNPIIKDLQNIDNVSDVQEAIPLSKNGSIDYKLLLENNPELFAKKWEERPGVGEDGTIKYLTNYSTRVSSEIEKKRIKLENTIDPNIYSLLEDEISDLNKKKEILENLLTNRYSYNRPSQQVSNQETGLSPYQEKVNRFIGSIRSHNAQTEGKKKRINLAEINKKANDLGFTINQNNHGDISVFDKDSKEVNRLYARKQSKSEIESHKGLLDYNTTVQQAINDVYATPETIINSNQWTGGRDKFIQGINDAVNGVKSVAANDVLDTIESVYKNGLTYGDGNLEQETYSSLYDAIKFNDSSIINEQEDIREIDNLPIIDENTSSEIENDLPSELIEDVASEEDIPEWVFDGYSSEQEWLKAQEDLTIEGKELNLPNNKKEDDVRKSINQTSEVRSETMPSSEGVGVQEERNTNTKRRNEQGGIREVSSEVAQETEVDENGFPFIKSSNGSIDFGFIKEETGLSKAPLRLVDGTASYGKQHLERNHSKEIQKAGFSSVENFVEYVASNYNTIRLGNSYYDNKNTYLLEVSDGKNNTLFIELSKDGEYWNVNSGGVFRKGYSKNKDVVWTLPAISTNPTVKDGEVASSIIGNRNGTNSASENSSQTTSISNNKDIENVSENQTIVENLTTQNEPLDLFAYADNILRKREVSKQESQVDTNPTEQQKKAGNYKMGHIKAFDRDITIENPKGSIRSGVDVNGKEWSQIMNNTYGYFKGTKGKDGDHIDCFIGDNLTSDKVFVIDQVNPDKAFDEHKAMLGFNSIEQAKDAYLSNYEDGWHGLGEITGVSLGDFNDWVDSSTRKLKPFSEYKKIAQVGIKPEYGTNNKIVSNNRYEELKNKMKGKLSQLNSGFDPEVFAIGAEMAAYHIEAGARKFSDFAERMINDFGVNIKPYLKSFYNGARDFPSMEEFAKEIDSYDIVNKLDLEAIKPNNNVYNRPESSSTDSENTEVKLQSNVGDIPDNGEQGGENRNVSSQEDSKRNERSGSKGGSGLFTDLFGESSDNDVYTPDRDAQSKTDDAGAAISTGNSPNSTEGLHVGSRANNADNSNARKVSGGFYERAKVKLALQQKAESIPIKILDAKNIENTLPFLLPEQCDDVLKAEKRFFSEDHKTKELANGKGMLFTNGTGTGKTYTGLGIVKRFVKQGKKDILIVVPTQPKVSDWANDGKNLGLDIIPLGDTSTGGSGVNVTTYANFRANTELLKRDFDLVVYDESHRLMEDKNGNNSSTTDTHYKVSNKDNNSALIRLQQTHPLWIEQKENIANIKNENDYQKLPETTPEQKAESIKRVEHLEELNNQIVQQQQKVLPALEERAAIAVEKTKVIFLSATPFKGHFNLRYANGLLFDWGNETTYEPSSRGQSRVHPEARFFLDNFGSAYEWKNHQLQLKINSNADAIAMQEVQFAEKLMSSGVISGRTINSEMDYSREFPRVSGLNTEDINKAFSDIFNFAANEYSGLRSAAREAFYSYNYSTQLFESLKTSMSIPIIKKHLELGRKVVVFHRRKQSNVTPPFATILESTRVKASNTLKSNDATLEQKEDASISLAQSAKFEREYSTLLEYEKSLNYSSAINQIQSEFGERAVYINGDISNRDKINAIKQFNTDNSGVDIIVIQEESGKEGISLHDTSGVHQRVLMNMSTPNSSTTALQIEGRIYRIGQESDAIFEYPLLGLDMEVEYFGRNINKRLSTTENLAIGEQSRDLIRSFAEGVIAESEITEPHTEQGKGGKENDKKSQEQLSDFRKAVLVYNTNQKKRGKRDQREGIDYYATPEPVGQKMVEWLGLKVGETAMEPSAGHGAIAMWFPSFVNTTSIEPSFSLYSKLNARSGGGDRKILNTTFEEFNIINKFDGIVMNPPFGSGGKMAIEHIEKAFKHLKENGRIVAIVPNGGSMQKRLDKFLSEINDNKSNQGARLIAEVILPPSTFEQAGTNVGTRVVVIDKVNSEDFDYSTKHIDLSQCDNVNELFNKIESIDINDRYNKVVGQNTTVNSGKIGRSDEMFDTFEQTHSKSGSILYMANPNAYLGDNYSKINSIAKEYDGYYSSYQNKEQKIGKGFVFKSNESRNNFLDKVSTIDNNINLHENSEEYGKGEYTTKSGDKITYQRIHNSDLPTRDSSTGSGLLQREESAAKLPNGDRLEFSHVERVFTESKLFSFTGSETIESINDVACIFKNLEDSSIENSFAVLVKNGNPTILHLSMGGYTSTRVNSSALIYADKKIGADKIYFIHNHPSGALIASGPDVEAHSKLKEIFQERLQDSIIINLKSGKFGTFNDYNSSESLKKDPKNNIPLKLYSFDKQIFDKDYNPSDHFKINDSKDVASFISSHRLGDRDKVSLLILNQGNKIVGNVFTEYDSLFGNQKEKATSIINYIAKCGGTSAIAYGRYNLIGSNGVADLVRNYSSGDFQLLDSVNIELNTRATDQGLMEPTINDESNIRFRHNISLDEINEQFNTDLQHQIDGALSKSHIYKLGNPSEILLSAGIPDLPIELAASTLTAKAAKDYVNAHPFNLAEIMNLPEAVQSPIAVFDSKTQVGSKVILTELESGGVNLVAALQINYIKGSETTGHIEINSVRSVYPKDQVNDIINWINNGLVKYSDTTKAPKFIDKLRSQFSQKSPKNLNALDSSTKILQNFNNPTIKEGEMIAEIENISQALNTPVEIIRDSEQIISTDNPTLDQKKRGSKGYYDTKTGKVVIVLANATSVDDVRATMLHEIVAHKGLRELFGDKFKEAIDDIYFNADPSIRKQISSLIAKNGWDYTVATEEYMASLAEKTNFTNNERSIWQKIKDAIKNMLSKVGIHLGKIDDNSLRYILKMSYDNLKSKGSIENYAKDILLREELGIGKVMFRVKESLFDKTASEIYEGRLKEKSYRFTETYQDSMLGLKEAQDAISKESKKDIKDYENAYMAENQLSSKNTYELEYYNNNYFTPLLESIHGIMKQKGCKKEDVIQYMYAKSGLERNKVFARRDAVKKYAEQTQALENLYKENLIKKEEYSSKLEKLQELTEVAYIKNSRKDYSGLTDLVGSDNFHNLSEKIVSNFEVGYENEIKSIWERTNTATRQTLKKTYDGGLMSKSTYETVRDMFEYYIPMRGFTEQTAANVYDYILTERSPFNAPVVSARGRKSLADDPISTIGNMAESAIMASNRNKMKQCFLNLAINHKSDLITVKDMWYVNRGTKDNPIWEQSFADTANMSSPDEISDSIEVHQKLMEELKKNGMAIRSVRGLELHYQSTKKEQSEHTVFVKSGGREYVLYINGNPRAAQAVNGLTNPDGVDDSIIRSLEKINRQLAANFTTRNPAFVLSNMTRDVIFATTAVAVKEDAKYASRFRKNILGNMTKIYPLLKKYQNGTLDMSNESERLFKEFLENGGETGYTALHNVDKYKKIIASQIDSFDGKIDLSLGLDLPSNIKDKLKVGGVAKHTVDGLKVFTNAISFMNRCAEDISRFSAYQTSRQMGRSVVQSVNDAKEITVNFNKKGAHNAVEKNVLGFSARGMKSCYLFFNAAIQSLNNFKKLHDKNKKGFYTALAGFGAMGFIVPLLNSLAMSMFGDDEDKDKYNNLPEWVRRNNFCIWIGGDRFITIPISIELRAFYGIGEIFYQTIQGNMKHKNIAYELANQMTELLPINPIGNNGDISSLAPDAIKPIAQILANKDYFGKPIYKKYDYNDGMPEYTRVYSGTSKMLISASELLNEITGGDKYTTGWIDINPAMVEHIFESFFGGMGKTYNQTVKTIYSVLDKDTDFLLRNTPVINRFLQNTDNKNAFSRINEEYYHYIKEYKSTEQKLRGYKKDSDMGILKYAEKIDFLYSSKDYEKYEIIKYYLPDIKELQNELNTCDNNEDKKYLQELINQYKSELVNELYTIESEENNYRKK